MMRRDRLPPLAIRTGSLRNSHLIERRDGARAEAPGLRSREDSPPNPLSGDISFGVIGRTILRLHGDGAASPVREESIESEGVSSILRPCVHFVTKNPGKAGLILAFRSRQVKWFLPGFPQAGTGAGRGLSAVFRREDIRLFLGGPAVEMSPLPAGSGRVEIPFQTKARKLTLLEDPGDLVFCHIERIVLFIQFFPDLRRIQ